MACVRTKKRNFFNRPKQRNLMMVVIYYSREVAVVVLSQRTVIYLGREPMESNFFPTLSQTLELEDLNPPIYRLQSSCIFYGLFFPFYTSPVMLGTFPLSTSVSWAADRKAQHKTNSFLYSCTLHRTFLSLEGSAEFSQHSFDRKLTWSSVCQHHFLLIFNLCQESH